MGRSLLLALLRSVLVVAGVVTLTFVLLHLAPGDPAQHLVGPSATADQIAALRHSLHLDASLAAQYQTWVAHLLQGDFGTSISTGQPVARMIGDAWPATAGLVVLSLGLSYVLGIALGLVEARTVRPAVKQFFSLFAVTLNAIPGYWLALVLVMAFAYALHWLPAFGAVGLDAEFLSPWGMLIDRARHVALPLITLTLIGVGGIARYTSTGLSDLARAAFIVQARAKGVPDWRIALAHQLRNAIIPLVALLGLSLPALFSGTVFVEAIFAWPGVGQLLVQGVQSRDYPLVMAAVVISASLVVVGNLLADVLVTFVDPRLRRRTNA